MSEVQEVIQIDLAGNGRLAPLATPMTRAYLESTMSGMLRYLGEETCRAHLLTLAKAPEELFHATVEQTQIMRADEALRAYADHVTRGGVTSPNDNSTYLDIAQVSRDIVILGVVDLYDGATVVAAIPTPVAVKICLSMLQRIQAAVDNEGVEVDQ
jgi:hypothetical protein